MNFENYLEYLDKLIRATDFSEQTSIDFHKRLRKDGLNDGEALHVIRFMEKSGWLKTAERSGYVTLTSLGRTVWQRNNLLAVHTIVVSETEATADGKEGVYATIRNDYARDETGKPIYGKEYGFQLWGVQLKGPLPEETAGFSTVENAEEAARRAYKDIRTGKLRKSSSKLSPNTQLTDKMSKKRRNIFGKLIALTKEIRLKQPNDESWGLHQFRGGNGKMRGEMRVSGIYLNWWFSERSRALIDELVEMATDEIPDLRFGNLNSLGEVIRQTLKDNAFNHELFIDVFLGDAATLFEARANPNAQEFAAALWKKLESTLSSSITKWLVIFPAIKLKSPTVEITSEKLFFLSPTDEASWRRMAAQYKINPDWDRNIGGSERGGNLRYFIRDFPFTWIACEVTGTQQSARDLAGRRFRKLIAVLFSVLYQRDSGIFTRSAMSASSDSIQFPAQGSSEPFTQIMSHIGELLPPFGNEIELFRGDINKIQDWYARFESSPDEIRSRCTAASQFVNYGIVAGELERFIHFSISVDALFGVRGKVEKTITRGLTQLYKQTHEDWGYRASKLFDLRSILVHGGCASIDEWDQLQRYRKHTNSHPLRDATDAALTAFWSFPNDPALYPELAAPRKIHRGLPILMTLAFLGGAYLGRRIQN